MIASAVAAAGILCFTSGTQPSPGYRIDFYVAPDGRDTWTGRHASPVDGDGPFATLRRAQLAVRQLRASLTSPRPIVVAVRGGTYHLDEPLAFTAADSGSLGAPVVWSAYPGEHPVISGGTRIAGWKVGADGRWRATLPEVAAGKWYFQALFVNGERRYRPRLPKKGYFAIAAEVPAGPEAAGKGFDRFGYAQGDIDPAWAGERDVEVLPFHLWTMSRMRLKSVDAGKRVATLTGPTASDSWWAGLQAGHRYLVENVRAALSEPGEFYLDRASGELTYIPMPGESPGTAEVIAPRIESLLELRGEPRAGLTVEHVSFSGLTFAHTNWVTPEAGYTFPQAEASMPAAVSAVNARRCTFSGCTVSHVAGYGMALGLGCRYNRVEDCVLTDLGAGGIKLGDTCRVPEEDANADHQVLRNNAIIHGGRTHPAGIGVWIGKSSYNRIEHNTIADFYYTGVSVGWDWGYAPSEANHNTIADNDIHAIGQGVLSDMGAIYTLGIADGSVLRGNYIHDIESFDYGGWGIYFDEGTTHMLAENNIVYRTKTGGFHQHYGKENVVRNNVFAFAREGQLQRSRVEEHLSFTFERNIVLWSKGPLLHGNWDGNRYLLDHNLYWRTDGGAFEVAGKSWKDWQAGGQDAHSLIADPRFRDPSKGDFHLAPGSPALALGFRPISIGGAGCRLPAGVPQPPAAAPEAFPVSDYVRGARPG